jgi:hypothetical protein
VISKDELLIGREKLFQQDYTQQISDNLDELLEKLNKIRLEYGEPMKVASGWRPPAVNASTKNAAPNSNHMTGHAADIADSDGKLWKWVISNLEFISDLGLYMEDKRWTPTWVHFQNLPPKSKKRIYIPSAALALAPNIWDGKYNTKFDK